MVEERVPGSIEHRGHVATKRRDPGEVPLVEPIRQVDEGREIAPRGDGADRDFAQMTPNSRPRPPIVSRQ
jgi:hypothetical protein